MLHRMALQYQQADRKLKYAVAYKEDNNVAQYIVVGNIKGKKKGDKIELSGDTAAKLLAKGIISKGKVAKEEAPKAEKKKKDK